ncbi:MAG: hypothetical protein AAB373_02805 [Patescibacteria group bacterium]
MKFKIFSAVLALSLLTLAGCAQTPAPEAQVPPADTETEVDQPETVVEPSTEPSEFDDWLTYESPKGFSFKYPQGYQVFQMTVSESQPGSEDISILHIVSTDNESPTPSLEINVSPTAVSFSLWEGMEWSAFPKIVETFETK